MSARRILLLITGIAAGLCMLQLLLIYNFSAIDHDCVHHNPQTETNEPTIVPSLPRADITLPCKISGTSLVAERLVSYEGSFVEDSNSAEMVIASALLLRNTGSDGVINAVVTLERGEEALIFEVTSLPPGECALVLEKNGRLCSQENFTACRGQEIRDSSDWLSLELLCISPVDMETVSVTNITNEAIPYACLYYKTMYADGLFYIGGITHEIIVEQLAPGETRFLRPEYYADIHSRIVRVSVKMQ